MIANKWYTPPALATPKQSNDKRIEVGVVAPNYGLEHLTYLMRLKRYRHVLLRRLPLHRLERQGTFWDKTPLFLRAPVPLVHTFNHLPANGPPFVLSFESELPFYLGPHREWQHQLGHRILASQRCRALLAMSDTAGDLARLKFNDLGLPQIAEKVQTFRGGVLPSLESKQRRYSSNGSSLRLIFVGADGLRKGVVPLIDAIQTLRDGGVGNIELTVVSSMMARSYAVVNAEPQVATLKRRLADAPWITHHQSLPYEQVRTEMSKHDLLVFPTLDETLGWVVIEAAMEGMATLASNVFALPELIEDKITGRIIDLPLNEGKRWIGLFEKDRQSAQDEAYERLRSGLVSVLSEVMANRALVPQWGSAAHAKLAGVYDPNRAAVQLQTIYDQAQSSGNL